MKAVTVRRPWSWAIASGLKGIENRTWRPRVDPKEFIAIHAGLSIEDVSTCAGYSLEPGPVGIVAVARVLEVVESSSDPWFTGPLGWVLGDVIRLDEPVECSGRQGLWTVPEPKAIEVVRRATSALGRQAYRLQRSL